MNQQAYVKRIAKSLICSKARRDEFVRDIESDIKAALAAEEPWEQIEARMGDPRQVAQEFNENLSETELAAGKRRKRNKIAIIVVGIVLAVIAALALAAWWFLPQQHSAGQSIGLDEQTIVAQAEDVIEVLNADDFDEFAAIATETMATPESEESLMEARTLISPDWGEFKSFSNAYCAEVVQAGQTLQIVEIGAQYENVSVTYTIVFNENMEVAGLFMK